MYGGYLVVVWLILRWCCFWFVVCLVWVCCFDVAWFVYLRLFSWLLFGIWCWFIRLVCYVVWLSDEFHEYWWFVCLWLGILGLLCFRLVVVMVLVLLGGLLFMILDVRYLFWCLLGFIRLCWVELILVVCFVNSVALFI